ncbi:MAG: BamA/TamA family outer membrane protein [Cyanobacteria bacterium J06638_20]
MNQRSLASRLVFLMLLATGATGVSVSSAIAAPTGEAAKPFSQMISPRIVTVATMASTPATAEADSQPQTNSESQRTIVASKLDAAIDLANQPADEPTDSASSVVAQVSPVAEATTLAEFLTTPTSTSAMDLSYEEEGSEIGLAIAATVPELAQAEPAAPANVQPPTVMQDPREGIDSITFSLFNWLTEPTALQGASRRRAVTTSIKSTGLALLGSVVVPLGENSHLGLVVEGGESILAFDLGFISASENPRSGFGANIFNQRSFLGAYRFGDDEVDLPNGETPWIHRLGAGVEYYLPFADDFESAIGLTYQRVSVRDDMFTSDVFAEDEEGNALTVDSDGIDDLLTFNFLAVRDNRVRPTPALTVDGNILRFGVNQGFNLGDEANAYTQIVGNYTEYLPLPLFRFDEGPRVLILNVQGGLGLGDVPSYEGFNIGGRSSVRGYSSGEISTASSFLQATAEYRFPVAQFQFRNRPVFMRGALFTEFATDFGTADEVIGEPAEARDKPGDGFGFGVGLHTILGSLYNRIELGISDDGDVDFIFTFGDRF